MCFRLRIYNYFNFNAKKEFDNSFFSGINRIFARDFKEFYYK